MVRRTIKDFINKIDKLEEYQIPKDMIKHVGRARQRYKEAGTEKDKEATGKEAVTDQRTTAKEKVALEREINDLVQKEGCQTQSGRYVELYFEEKDESHLERSLELKRKADGHAEEIAAKKRKLSKLVKKM